MSGLLDAPAAIGWFRPIVLVPAGALAGLPSAHMEALLLHELAHIRRHDYLVQILQSVVEAVVFYHPGVWWISGDVRTERELCCDDIAVSITGDAVMYARALAEFDSARFIQPTVVAANGGSVAGRIARLLGQSSATGRASIGTATAAALLLLAMGMRSVFAQTAGWPQFEVASIKPSFSERIMNVRALPGRLTADASLQVLMQYAYDVQPFQVVGGPGWLTSERYQIEATADATASRLEEWQLQERFNRPEADAAPPVLALGPGGAQLHGGKIAMPEVVRTLSMLLGRSVIDRTGFTQLFDLQLEFVPDDTTPAMPPPPPDSGISGVSIAQALQQQLGLRLAATKGPVQVIVVDQAERPSAN